MEHPDSLLLKRVLLGERGFYALLVEHYGPAVAAVAAHYINDPKEIEKVTSDSLIEAFRELRRFDNLERFFPYLLEVTRNKSRTSQTAKNLHQETLNPACGKNSEAIDDPLTQIVRWKYFEGLSYEEIARRLGTDSEGVQLQLRRGRSLHHLSRCGEPTR